MQRWLMMLLLAAIVGFLGSLLLHARDQATPRDPYGPPMHDTW